MINYPVKKIKSVKLVMIPPTSFMGHIMMNFDSFTKKREWLIK